MDHLTLLAGEQTLFAERLRGADLDAPVQHCLPWTVTDLTLHLAGVHQFAAGQARMLDADRSTCFPAGPRDRDGLVALYEDCAQRLVSTLEELGPKAPSRTFLGPGTADFWQRRQLHETLIHRWDLELATGHRMTLDSAVADDTIDEVFDLMLPLQLKRERLGPITTSIDVTSETTARTWRLGPGGAPTATVAGTSSVLALLLWRRTTLGDSALTVTGDDEALAGVLSQRITP